MDDLVLYLLPLAVIGQYIAESTQAPQQIFVVFGSVERREEFQLVKSL
jgi:hypothetical protein